MKWLQLARIGAELLVDLVTGKLEKRPPTAPSSAPLRHVDAERIARASREAGPPCPVPPPGWRCTRRAGHSGPCAAVRLAD